MNGILIVNKPSNYTSHDIVYKVKKITGMKVGHTGTLDPMATGVLPLLIGKGTLCSKYLINHDKIYNVKLQLGIKTDTADSEGNIIEQKEVKEEKLSQNAVEKTLNDFIGKQEQIPPMYSAIKVNGKKLYEYARKGEKVEIKPRKIEIYDIKLLKIDKENKQIEFCVKCSKGTYIRSLCEDISEKLDTVGYMIGLERVQVGEFNIKQAISIEELANNKEIVKDKIITVEELFRNLDKIELDKRKLELFLNGVQLSNSNIDVIYRIYSEENFIGIGIVKNKLLKRDIII